jgi:hypothetical protein
MRLFLQCLLLAANGAICVAAGLVVTEADKHIPFGLALVVGLLPLALWLWFVFMPLWARVGRHEPEPK